MKNNQGWRTIGGKKKYFRSIWEANYARYLEFMKVNGLIVDWLHEPQTFWFEGLKRGTVSYLPDFKVLSLDGKHYFVEVKGFYDAKSKTKIKRFAKYFPDETLRLVDSKWFASNGRKIRGMIKDWEVGKTYAKTIIRKI